MSRQEGKVLKILFAIDQSTINNDLRRAESDLRSVVEDLQSLLAIPYKEKTPETRARIAHLFMVQAYGLCQGACIPQEVKTFYAAWGAGHVAQDAEMVAMDRDRVAEPSAQMNAIRKREGLAEDEFWLRREGPPDYEALDRQIGHLLENIHDTVLTFILRRYWLENTATLIEKDRAEFEIQREIGRRATLPYSQDSAEFELSMDALIVKDYGDAALRRVRLRVEEIRSEFQV